MSTYLVNVYTKVGVSYYILSDNDSQFQNPISAKVVSSLGAKQVHSSLYYTRGDGYIENMQNFLKTCIKKHVSSESAWDEMACITCVTYNIVSN